MKANGWHPLIAVKQETVEKEIKEAYKEIEKLTNIARESINKAREIAEKYGLVFSVDFGYIPKRVQDQMWHDIMLKSVKD